MAFSTSEEAAELGGIGERGRKAELVDFEDLGLDGDAVVFEVVAANDDVVGVERLGDADGGGARGAEVGGKAEMVEGVEAVVVGEGEEAGRGESLVEGVREGVADPVEIRVSGAVVEGQDEDDAAASLPSRAG